MTYKTYRIVQSSIPLPSRKPARCVAIYFKDRIMSYADDYALAKRAIDSHTASGIWPRPPSEQITMDSLISS